MRRLLFAIAPVLMAAGCHDGAEARCFSPEAVLPTRASVAGDPKLGASARDLADALFGRDLARAERLLAADPALARVRVGPRHSMLTVAMASCDPRAVDLLVARGAPLDPTNDGGTLKLALMADDPGFALRLLKAGADPSPAEAPLGPFGTAAALGSAGGVRMLLDHGLDPDTRDRVGRSPLQVALDTERFRVAELLLDRGADPWTTDVTGGTLGHAVAKPMITRDAEEDAARARLAARLPRLGWPSPPPKPAEVRKSALAGRWPPAGVKAPPVPPHVLAIMAENEKRAAGARTQ